MNIDGTGPLWKRLGWFVAIWGASVAALAMLASLLRAWLHP